VSQLVKVRLLDDLHLSEGREVEAERTLPFEVDGNKYEIDLNSENEERFLQAVGPFLAAARPVRMPKGRSRPRSDRNRTARIREWARDRGIQIKERGRIPAYVESQYDAAHS
jgi:hypothetical protein